MKVQELIEILEQQNPDDLVIIARDGDGNGYSPLADYSLDIYDSTSTYSGACYIRKLTPELIKQGFCEEDLCANKDAKDCITLWPTY